jgi:hypothetical protein
LRSLRLIHALSVAAATLLISPTTFATIVPFTEEFTADAANWRDAPGTASLSWIAAGGPDGSSYASGPFNFLLSASGDTPAILRAQDEFNSSNNAFVGNWIADGVNQFSVAVRHNAPAPLTYFARISGPANFPAVAAVNFAPVAPNAWTTLVFPIVPGNPQFVFEGPPSTFTSVFGNVGHIQIGVSVPAALAGQNQMYTFDVDKASITPEPASLAMLLAGALLWTRRGKRIPRGSLP